MQKSPTPELYSHEGKNAVDNYGKFDKYTLIATTGISIGGALSIFDDELNNLPIAVKTAVWVCIAILFVAMLGMMVYGLVNSVKANGPALNSVKKYVCDTLDNHPEGIDLTRNVATYRLTVDDNKKAYVLKQEETGTEIIFDRSAVMHKTPLDVNLAQDIETYVKYKYLLRAESGRIPLSVVLYPAPVQLSKSSAHVGNTPLANPKVVKKPIKPVYIVVNGALHKSITHKAFADWEKE